VPERAPALRGQRQRLRFVEGHHAHRELLGAGDAEPGGEGVAYVCGGCFARRAPPLLLPRALGGLTGGGAG
jgi:hypothetical protein